MIRGQFVKDLCKAMSEARIKAYDADTAMSERLLEPAPRFYVTPKVASDYIYKIEAYGEQVLDGMTPNKKQMYHDLYAVVKNLRQIQEYKTMPIYKLVRTAVEQQAPQFYVSLSTAKNIIKKHCKS